MSEADKDEIDSSVTSSSVTSSVVEEDEVIVEVPRVDDDELTSFFKSPSDDDDRRQLTLPDGQLQDDKQELASVDTFNDIFVDSNDMYSGPSSSSSSRMCYMYINSCELGDYESVSYTHLTLPTNREV